MNKTIKLSLVVLLTFSIVACFTMCMSNKESAILIVGDSMAPTLHDGQTVNADTTFSSVDLQKGTIVVFTQPSMPNTHLVKRIIATAGDYVEIINDEVYVNDEKYITKSLSSENSSYIGYWFGVVPDSQFYVLGDNYHNSCDSREYGYIPIKSIVGVVKE